MADERTSVFFHKKYRRYRIGRFEFKKNYLRLTTNADREEFLKLVNDPKFPKREAIQIVEVNEEARAQSERSVLESQTPSPSVDGSDTSVVRGAMNASDILTAKDVQRINDLSSKPGQSAGGLNPTPSAPKPTFDISKMNLGAGNNGGNS